MTSTDLNSLFARVADGDRRAVEPAFEALWPIVRRYCLKLLHNEPDAEDATQSSLAKMFEQAADYDRNRSAVGWALAFAYWECRTERKRTQRSAGRNADIDDTTAEMGEASPETHLAERELQEMVQELLAALPSADRALLDDEEIGPALRELSPAARRKRKQRLIERLRRAVDEIIRPGGSGRWM